MPVQIAIIGFAFRLPNTTRETFWDDLLEGRDLVTSVPADRWSQDTFYHPRKDHPGTSYSFAAGSIGDVSQFDADFFGISPREAAIMDPQQRLLLELGWEALEHAGIKPSQIKGSQCGVYVGISNIDYVLRLTDDLAAIDSSAGTGNTSSIAANRLSYFFDLHGPSMAIDTACSSSLVAFHQACSSIAAGECNLALAGGVSLHLHPYTYLAFSKASMLSRKGHCNVFDAACDGYVRSEGAGLFLLKEYNQAITDGDRILAVVAASAVNTDGRKSGLTVPSAAAQASLLRETYQKAGINPAEIDYLEAHGTGTAVGDPIETQAIGEALGRQRPSGEPLVIGSVKSNLGHLESAAGVAGLVKALLCIQNRTIPATIGIKKFNPAIPFTDLNIEVATQNKPIKKSGEIIVGVNSFGFGGANAHVVLKSHAPLQNRTHLAGNQAIPLVLSAKNADALRATASNFAAYLDRYQQLPVYDIAYNAFFHREKLEYQAVVFGSSHKEIAEQLQAFSTDKTHDTPVETGTRLALPAGPVFVYSGNGSQWFGMGKRLLADPVFQKSIQEVDALFSRYADWSLENELAGQSGIDRYTDTEIAQPALFAIQVGITQMLRQRGVHPVAVTGHSVGEVAAAWASGALSLEAAVQVIYHRSQLQGTTKGQGQMTAIGTGEAEVRRLLTELGLSGTLTLAGINSSKGITIAGPPDLLARLETALSRQNIFNKRLDLDYAFHSPAMDPLESGILTALSTLTPQPSAIPFYSTVAGSRLDGDKLDATYWWHNLRKPVLFSQTIRQILHEGTNVFIEVGPNAILRSYLNDCLQETQTPGSVIATGMRGDDNPQRITGTVSQAIISGLPIDWDTIFPQKAAFVELPHYPWQREQHWHTTTPESFGLLNRRKTHCLLGYKLPQHDFTWENQLDTNLIPLLADHQVGDAIVFPGAGFVELALAAAHSWQPQEYYEIEELEIKSPLLLKEERSKLVRLNIDPTHGGLSIQARELLGSESWEPHVTGRIMQGSSIRLEHRQRLDLPEHAPDFTEADHHLLTENAGLGYGPAFRVIDHGWVKDNSVVAVFRDAGETQKPHFSDYHLHPAYLDCAFQLIFQLLKDHLSENEGIVFIPVKIGRVILHDTHTVPHCAKATLLRRAPHSLMAEFIIADAEGTPLALIQETRFRAVRLSTKRAENRLDFLAYHSVPCPHPITVTGASPLPFEQLQREMRDAVNRAVFKGTHRSYSEEVDPLLDALCSRFMLETVQSLLAGNQVLSQETIQNIRSNIPDKALFLDHLLTQSVIDGFLTEHESSFRLSTANEGTFSAQDIWNSLLHDYPEYFPILHNVARVGMHLKDILTEPGVPSCIPELNAVAHLMRNLLGSAAKNKLDQALQHLLTNALQKLSTGDRLGVLEISDGLPLFASTVCKTLDFDCSTYLFATDNSETAEEARQYLDQFPAAGIHLLEQPDATATPLHGPSYNLAIITSDVSSIDTLAKGLRFASSQLSTDGLLMFIGHYPSRWADFVFGSHHEWWLESPSGPPLSRQQPPSFWQRRLELSGFSEMECLELSPGTSSGPYLLLARRTEPAAGSDKPVLVENESAWLIIADSKGYSADLANHLSEKLQNVGGLTFLTTGTSASELADEVQRIKAMHGGLRGIIHLSGLLAQHDEPLELLEMQTDRCSVAAAIIKACETTQTTATCWLGIKR